MNKSKKKNVLALDANELRHELVQLWSPLFIEETDFNVDIGALDRFKDKDGESPLGLCLGKRTKKSLWDSYFRSRNIKPQQTDFPLIIITNEQDKLGGPINTAIHEFAHVIRNKFAVVYPKIYPRHKKTQTTKFSEKEALLCGFEQILFPNDGLGVEPLLGNLACTWLQCDTNHDPLFYFIFYILEKKATEKGFGGGATTLLVSNTFD
ncbi:MAG: hypothetical protein V1855_00410 [bacterium]